MGKETSKEFFKSVPGLGPEWEVSEVTLNESSHQVTLALSLRSGAKVVCPECGESCAMYDRNVSREWRHFDTMQLKTVLRARVPGIDCPVRGPQTIRVPLADPMARFTPAFEAQAIDLLEKVRSTTQACKLLKIGRASADLMMTRGVARGLPLLR